MKKIECYIRPEKLESVKEGLFEKGIKGMSIHNVKGHGHQRGIKLVDRSGEYSIPWIDKLKIDLIVSDHVNINEIIGVIIANAQTGQPGDGKIFVSSIEKAIRIRTNESGEEIL